VAGHTPENDVGVGTNATTGFDEQRYWNDWNRTWRSREGVDPFMERQRDIAISIARETGSRELRILDVGCGTGWLGNSLLPFGQVWGADLSVDAIAEGTRRHSGVSLICGDFLTVEVPGPFDLVVTADGIAHMPDHAACISRIADLTRPGGTLLLMTENPRVWQRRSTLRPLPPSVPHARPEEWPSLAVLRQLLLTAFTIQHVTSIEPGGDRGALWWVENRYVRGGMSRLVGRDRWRSLLERAGLGRELIIVATRI
jgi:2-polyprenyl-3-methyl-5-hydroxy-6-metoxy-1,4-benzoquinol methylase